LETSENGIIYFTDYENKTDFLDKVLTKFEPFQSGTRQDLALSYSLTDFLNLPQNAPRNDSQLHDNVNRW